MLDLKTLREKQIALILSPSVLDLHILPTEKCNFRCVYCYEDFLIGKMKPTIVSSVKKLILNRMPELKQLRISWFGGEPLAASDVVVDISNFAKKLAVENDCHFNFGMTTNGYLLNKPRFKSIIESGVTSFQISLDGYEDTHNKTRLRADGSGTFNTIWNNLLNMAKTPYQFEVILRVHVTPENFKEIPLLLKAIKSNFNADHRFKVFLKAIANLGGPNAGNFETLVGKTKEEILIQLNDILGSAVISHELSKNGLPYICYASAQNSWVIRADGSLAKCTVAFNDDRNKIGFLKENGTLSLEQNKIQLWLRGLKNLGKATMGCPAHNLPQLKSGKLSSIPVVIKQA
jgi:uncharacterized protein